MEYNDISWNNFRDVLEASVWVGQHNVTGLGITEAMWYSGGYSYLHKNVTIYHFDNPYNFSTFYPLDAINFTIYSPIIPRILAEQHLINYLIVPKYKYIQYPDLVKILNLYDYRLVKVIMGSCDIYYV